MRPYPKTKRGARRQYDAIIRQCLRDATGGLGYGLDMPTLRATWPDRYLRLRWIQHNMAVLPD